MKAVTTFEQFRDSLIDNTQMMSFDEFKEKTNLHGFWNKIKDDDHRKEFFENKEEFLKFYYNYFIVNIDWLLLAFYRQYVSYKGKLDFDYNIAPLKNNTIKQNTDNTGYFRSVFHVEMAETQQRVGQSIKNTIHNLYHEAKFVGFALLPRFIFRHIKHSRLHDVPEAMVVTMKTQCGWPSVFSQSVYRALLHHTKQFADIPVKDLLCPTASWGSPVVAARHQGYDNVHLVDVMGSALEKCHKIYNDTKPTTLSLFDDEITDYQLKTFCTPSEKMAQVLPIEYDQIFFCPPYFTLERYPGEEQSTNQYSDYQSWLEKYWRATCRESDKVLKKGGTYTFVISTILDGVNIADDLTRIASEFFTHVNDSKIVPLKKNLNFENDARFEKVITFKKV